MQPLTRNKHITEKQWGWVYRSPSLKGFQLSKNMSMHNCCLYGIYQNVDKVEKCSTHLNPGNGHLFLLCFNIRAFFCFVLSLIWIAKETLSLQILEAKQLTLTNTWIRDLLGIPRVRKYTQAVKATSHNIPSVRIIWSLHDFQAYALLWTKLESK